MIEKIRTGEKIPVTAETLASKETLMAIAAGTAEIYLEVGAIEDFFWDELGNPRVQAQHEFENNDEVVLIINIISPTAIGINTISGYDYSIVDTEILHRHDWSGEIDPEWSNLWIIIASEFNVYGTPIKGITAGDYFCSGILYAYINELDSISDPYTISVTEAEVPIEELKCPIACVCVGTDLIDELGPLREFRDGVLKRMWIGRKFIGFYYNNLNKYLTPILGRYGILKRIGRIFIRLAVKR